MKWYNASHVASSFHFRVTKSSNQHKGRMGQLKTPHGMIETPVFMPVGTLGSIKGVLPEQLMAEGTQIILANTYHLFLRPGMEVLENAGGIHAFMNWHLPILTDSGGFQVFSLNKLNQVTDEGVVFQSHLDGSRVEFTPERVIDIQQKIGADLIMPLDECLPCGASYERTKASIERTYQWEKRCQEYHLSKSGRHEQALFAIIQGGMFPDLRLASAKPLVDLNFFGYAIGGLSVGESREKMSDLVCETVGHIPKDKPRYLMGVGTPEDLVTAIEHGVDMFDCVAPTRLARHGAFFTRDGTFSIKKKIYELDMEPLDDRCECYTCRQYSRSYLRHLWRNKELNAMTLMSIHNIRFLRDVVERKKEEIRSGS